MKRILVLGIGNMLMSDEGVGVAVVKKLMSEDLPPGVEVMDAGCALCDTLIGLAEFDRLIIIDAVQGGGSPGCIYRFGEEVLAGKDQTPGCTVTLHEIGLLESIAMVDVSGIRVPPITIIGVEPLRLELGTELSDIIKSKVPEIVKLVKSELADGLFPLPV